MAIAEIQGIIKDPKKLKQIFGSTPTLIGDIPVDVLLNESPGHDWIITDHPVEAGLDISDSRYKRPVSVALDCVFTNPDYSLDTIIAGGAPWKQALWYEKKEALEALSNQNIIIDIVTPDNTYENFMIDAIQPTYSKDIHNAFSFRLNAVHIETVSSEIVSVSASQVPKRFVKKDPKKDKIKKKSSMKTKGKHSGGKKTAKKIDPKSKKQSILNKLIGKYL